MAGSTLDSKESFALYHQTYGGDKRSKDCPLVVIHGLIGSTTDWHQFCKSYSERTERKVQYEYYSLVFLEFMYIDTCCTYCLFH
jgi:hypothetical protein